MGTDKIYMIRCLYLIVIPLVDVIVIYELVYRLMLLITKRNKGAHILSWGCSIYYYFLCFEALDHESISITVRNCIWLIPYTILLVVLFKECINGIEYDE